MKINFKPNIHNPSLMGSLELVLNAAIVLMDVYADFQKNVLVCKLHV